MNTVHTSLKSGDPVKTTFKVTTILINVILLLLRIALLLKKNEVLETLSKLDAFKNGLHNKSQTSLQKYAVFACCWCFMHTITIVIITTAEIFINTDNYLTVHPFVGRKSTWDQKLYFFIYMAGHSTIYLMNFLVFPGLIIILLSFIYLSFVKTFQMHLEALRIRLLERFSKEEISRALAIFTVAKKTHLNIEKSLQLFSFLAYVLIFSNILQMISGIVTNFMSDKGMMQVMYTYVTLGVAIVWFIALTLCGTQVGKTEVLIRNLSQDVITKNFAKEVDGHKKLVYMNLFNACTNFELKFTGCGMFVVDKKLFLTVTGIMVTYGVLFATEVSKM
ncbi:uncharacterized protein TNCT_697081 [Trichonephila clavata]|uniref:Gustatory receptor n=1 Tax=Trichonephila clavata TaxID=2740835 RepID=A0A8X6FN87_TRICU|nr:uncharacterized protein TNCT_697081 [Trichonephila clavata]